MDRTSGQLLLHIPGVSGCLTLRNAILRICRTHIHKANGGHWAQESAQQVRVSQRLTNLTTCELLQLQPAQVVISTLLFQAMFHVACRCRAAAGHAQLLPQSQSSQQKLLHADPHRTYSTTSRTAYHTPQLAARPHQNVPSMRLPAAHILLLTQQHMHLRASTCASSHEPSRPAAAGSSCSSCTARTAAA